VRRWLSSANASCSSRVTPYFSATSSAVSPSETIHRASNFGLTKRQPSTLSATSGTPRGNAVSGFSITNGARLIDSVPPATKVEPSPAPIAWCAAFTACSPDPHSRFTV
jgi:hypothetical protein